MSSTIDWVKGYARQAESAAVKRVGTRPDNCEYPWEDGTGKIQSPLDWTFHPSKLLIAPAGRTFLKIVREAIKQHL